MNTESAQNIYLIITCFTGKKSKFKKKNFSIIITLFFISLLRQTINVFHVHANIRSPFAYSLPKIPEINCIFFYIEIGTIMLPVAIGLGVVLWKEPLLILRKWFILQVKDTLLLLFPQEKEFHTNPERGKINYQLDRL